VYQISNCVGHAAILNSDKNACSFPVTKLYYIFIFAWVLPEVPACTDHAQPSIANAQCMVKAAEAKPKDGSNRPGNNHLIDIGKLKTGFSYMANH
jgi:hypothetical protein